MKTQPKHPKQPTAPKAVSAEERGLAAAKAMSKALKAEHKRWGMPLLAWNKGRIIRVNP